MSWSLRLLRIRGIEVKVHLTFVLILIWAAFRWGIATGAGLFRPVALCQKRSRKVNLMCQTRPRPAP